jgi:hypothetical protein
LQTKLRSLAKLGLPRIVSDLIFAINTHRRIHGEFPRILRPRTFNEKILRRKVFDRRAILTTFVDKLAVRDYVANRVGERMLPQLYCVTADPHSIDFSSLPQRFVVKAAHGSGWVRIVLDKSAVDCQDLVTTCQQWLSANYYDVLRERQYRNVPPRILIEEFLDDGSGNSPCDYKLFVFGGKVRFIQIDVNRFSAHRQAVYDRDWQDTGVKLTYERIAGQLPRPPNLQALIETAETLSDNLDFVRVDLYDVGERIYFGEMTPTPACGFTRFQPRAMDDRLGSLWKAQSKGAG